MRTTDAPSHNRFSHFRCEEAYIIDVNRDTYTVRVETRHSAKDIDGIQCLVPYHHFSGGEGIHHLPEVGAICLVAFPSDNTPPFVLGYKGAASAVGAGEGGPETSTVDGEGAQSDVSFRSRRPELNPGDIAFTTRDENFVVLRRGGVVQIGATPISQRVYIPVLNYIKDFAENYEMHTFGGDVMWTVERQENDPGGNAPSTYVFHMNEFAQDAKATVRIRHLPLSGPGGGDKAAWEVKVSPQGIDRDTGEVSSEEYSLLITTGGDKTEIIGASRNVTVRGDDTLEVQGKQDVTVQGDALLTTQGNLIYVASAEAVLGGSLVKLGGRSAANPAVKGLELVNWLATSVWPVTTLPGGAMVASPSPAAVAALQQILSQMVYLKQ